MEDELKELKAMMQQQIAIAEDTNSKVRSLHGAAQRAAFVRFIYWGLIIGSGIWLAQYMGPVIKLFPQLMQMEQTLSSTVAHTQANL